MVKSFIFESANFVDIPNKILNQLLQKPTIPKKFTIKIKKKHKNGENWFNAEKIVISDTNFIVPGTPENIIIIIKIAIAKLGVVCITPQRLVTLRVLYLFCMQSTKKNINDDKNACVNIK